MSPNLDRCLAEAAPFVAQLKALLVRAAELSAKLTASHRGESAAATLQRKARIEEAAANVRREILQVLPAVADIARRAFAGVQDDPDFQSVITRIEWADADPIERASAAVELFDQGNAPVAIGAPVAESGGT